MATQSTAAYRALLDEVCEDHCPADKYCLLKELLSSMHPSRRLVVQLKCLELFKFRQSETQQHDIGRTEAWREWIDDGYAEAFAKHYDDTTRFRDIYRRVLATVAARGTNEEETE
jgi:hypothetical protein